MGVGKICTDTHVLSGTGSEGLKNAETHREILNRDRFKPKMGGHRLIKLIGEGTVQGERQT